MPNHQEVAHHIDHLEVVTLLVACQEDLPLQCMETIQHTQCLRVVQWCKATISLYPQHPEVANPNHLAYTKTHPIKADTSLTTPLREVGHPCTIRTWTTLPSHPTKTTTNTRRRDTTLTLVQEVKILFYQSLCFSHLPILIARTKSHNSTESNSSLPLSPKFTTFLTTSTLWQPQWLVVKINLKSNRQPLSRTNRVSLSFSCSKVWSKTKQPKSQLIRIQKLTWRRGFKKFSNPISLNRPRKRHQLSMSKDSPQMRAIGKSLTFLGPSLAIKEWKSRLTMFRRVRISELPFV